MSGLNLRLEHPWYLLTLALVPVLWVIGRQSLNSLGRVRRWFVLAALSSVIALSALALAELQVVKTSPKITVTYLLDQSESIPPLQRQVMLEYVRREVEAHRDPVRGDCAGVIVFGRDAVVEVPPFDDDIPFLNLESSVGLRTDGTNLAAAIKLALATFPEDSSKRMVIVSDGNENLGDARAVARGLAEQGVGVDVVPVRLKVLGEVQVEKVVLPSEIRQGQPVEARVVVNNFAAAEQPGGGIVRGRLRLVRQVGAREELLNPDPQSQQVALEPGKNVFSFQHLLDEAAVYTYKAVFAPDDPAFDLLPQNNEASAFTYVRGKGRVLFIEDRDNKGEFDHLIRRLRTNNIEVTLQASDQLFRSLAELQQYDAVVLANVPRSSAADPAAVSSFGDDQIRMLVRNTEQFGCGLIMLGGPNSFGAGGWSNTELEKAMPVDFQIKNTKVRAVGALAMVMHASEMADGNHWQKKIASAAVSTLGPMDYCGLIHWGPGREEWLWGGKVGLIQVRDQRKMMMGRIDRMTPGDMPDFEPALKMALAGFNRVPASVKHMIAISDGDPTPPNPATLAAYKTAGIKISTVAIAAHGAMERQTLQNIATATGGKYYAPTSPKALPRIFQYEARRVARPLVQDLNDVPPRLDYPHEMLQGIHAPLPPLRGFVMTQVKENTLVEVALLSPVPETRENGTILASWTYGMGRTVVFTTDAGARWAGAWTEWKDYDKFFTQMIRWAMRPVNEDAKLSIASEVKDGRVRVVVTALDKDDKFLNFLTLSSAGVNPDLESFDVKIDQVAPGRYVGEFDADKAGSYFLSVSPGPGKAPILTGVNVPYSAEFRDRETNETLLRALAGQTPKGGPPGRWIDGELVRDKLDRLLAVDTFRDDLPKAKSSQDIWPLLLVINACAFLGYVFIRRVAIHFYWVGPAIVWCWQRVLRRERQVAPDERLERLRSRKAAIAEQIDERRAAVRFEPQVEPGSSADAETTLQTAMAESGSPPAAPPPPAPEKKTTEPEDSYTARLLAAKKQAWKDK